MGMARHDAYALLLQGSGVLEFVNGLSTNLVTGPCTTAFTNRAAKIIDVCEVVPVGANVALIGFNPHKQSLINHLSDRILGQPVTINDISDLNDVFIGTGEPESPEGATVHASYFGTMYIVPARLEWNETWSQEEWNEHRIAHQIPFYGHEITPAVHPLGCALGDLVHPQKGCYVGQEVLVRMRSRGKMGHRLVRRVNPVEKATTVGEQESLLLERIQ
jgi:folate-binding protein YgfZ